MKQLFLFLVLFLSSFSVFSQETVKLTPKNVQVTVYDEKSPVNYTKDTDSSFLITITDTNVVLSTKYPDGKSIEYKVTENIFSDQNTKLLRCKTLLNTEVIVAYHDVVKEYGCIWVVMDFSGTEYRYQCIKY